MTRRRCQRWHGPIDARRDLRNLAFLFHWRAAHTRRRQQHGRPAKWRHCSAATLIVRSSR